MVPSGIMFVYSAYSRPATHLARRRLIQAHGMMHGNAIAFRTSVEQSPLLLLNGCVQSSPSQGKYYCNSPPIIISPSTSPTAARAFHASPIPHGQKKRRTRASHTRRKKKRDEAKEQRKKRMQRKREQRSPLSLPSASAPVSKYDVHARSRSPDSIHRPGLIPDPLAGQHRERQREVPHAFLARTASEHAYVAKCAVMDERTGELFIDPDTLFEEVAGGTSRGDDDGGDNKRRKRQAQGVLMPRIFRNSHFRYFSPASFPNHEPPRDGTPEVAFLGRSNTGKSSLINALSSMIIAGGRGGALSKGGATSASGGGELARTSKTPGRTQTVNYFGLVDNSADGTSSTTADRDKGNISYEKAKLYLVDLPGFGYASAPGESVDQWQKNTQEFLIARSSAEEAGSRVLRPWPKDKAAAGGSDDSRYGAKRSTAASASSPPLKRLYLLIDSRLPDPTMIDLTVMGWCDEYSIPYTIVLTKVDGSTRANCVKLTNQMCMRYHSMYNDTQRDEADYDDDCDHDGTSGSGEDEGSGEVFMDPVVYWTSAKDGLGMEELLLSVENNMFALEEDYDVEDEFLDD